MNKTETTRLRLFFYTSIEEWEAGSATRSVLVTGELSLGQAVAKFFNDYKEEVYLIEVKRNPRY